jgi:hypothetical protein
MLTDHITPAIDRLFRAYYNYCVSWTEDSLFQLLNSLHSLDDRFTTRHGRIMLELPEYIALKAVRNHFHHAEEVRNVVKVKSLVGADVSTDLLYACLINHTDIESAISGVTKKYRQNTVDSINTSFKRWGAVWDINPAVFNCVVKVYELTVSIGLVGTGKDFLEFDSQYKWESKNGHSHYVTGAIQVFLPEINKYIELMELLYKEPPLGGVGESGRARSS